MIINFKLFILLLSFNLIYSQDTILEEYVYNFDPNTSYSLVSSETGIGYNSYILDINSQMWLTEDDVDRPIWQHWLLLVVPWDVDYETAFLLINGGSNNVNPPNSSDEEYLLFSYIAIETKSVLAILSTVPNEPLTFSDEGFSRTEDEIIAYSWEKFLTTDDNKWPLQLPMTKSAVVTMDVIQDFCSNIDFFSIDIEDFFVTGGSKRGWTTWLTAAVDNRVRGIAPIVFDALNLVQSFRHHYGSYGEWSPAVHDYEDMGIFDWFIEPNIQDLMHIVDPLIYKENLTMPKLIPAATGDEFFVPAAQFYFNELPGDNFMAYYPNTGHAFSGEEVNLLENLTVFYQAVLDGISLPDYSWVRNDDGSLFVNSATQPSGVSLWQATNPNARDFRDYVVGDAWTNTPLSSTGNGNYVAEAHQPESGWTGMFVELQYDLGYDYPLMVTTEVSIFPDDLPFATDVTINIIGSTSTAYSINGSLTAWEMKELRDGGTDGDENANDGHWTAVIPAVADGSYSWFAYSINADGSTSLISGEEPLIVNISGDNVTGTFVFSTSQTGDINMDGAINILDVILTVNIILNSEFNQAADMNNDGAIDILDIVLLVNIILDN